jgi:hypothetical protein
MADEVTVRTSGSYFERSFRYPFGLAESKTLAPRGQGCTAVSGSSPERATDPDRHTDPERNLPEIMHFHFRPVGAGL